LAQGRWNQSVRVKKTHEEGRQRFFCRFTPHEGLLDRRQRGCDHLGGGIDPVYNAISIAELAVEKGTAILLMPVSSRRQSIDLSDDMATKITIQFYSDAVRRY